MKSKKILEWTIIEFCILMFRRSQRTIIMRICKRFLNKQILQRDRELL